MVNLHKSEDLKTNAVKYYLIGDKHNKKFVKYSSVLQEV